MTLEEIYNEYRQIIEAKNNGNLSLVHAQGALAYLELKAQNSGIMFVAPELSHNSKEYVLPEGRPPMLAEGDSDYSSSEDMFDEERSEAEEESLDADKDTDGTKEETVE